MMRSNLIKQFSMVIALAMMVMTGCAEHMTFDNVTYNTIKTTEVTLKVAMSGFGKAYRSSLNENHKYISEEDYSRAKQYSVAAMKAHNGFHKAYNDWKLAGEPVDGKSKIIAAQTLMNTAVDIFMDFVKGKEANIPVPTNSTKIGVE
jgi:hypothetical protein